MTQDYMDELTFRAEVPVSVRVIEVQDELATVKVTQVRPVSDGNGYEGYLTPRQRAAFATEVSGDYGIVSSMPGSCQ